MSLRSLASGGARRKATRGSRARRLSSALLRSEHLEDRALMATFADAGFEFPVQPANNWEQANGTGGGSLAGANWTFSPSAGITQNGSAFGPPAAPEGTQAGILQQTASVTQVGSGFVIGDAYTITIAAASRSASYNNLEIFIDGEKIMGGLVGWNGVYRDATSNVFIATSTTPTILIQATNPLGGDRTTFIDNIRINNVVLPTTPTISNSSFENGPVANFPEYQLIDTWVGSSPNSGLNGPGDPFLNGKAIPNGSRVGFIQSFGATNSLTQTITGLTPGNTYQIEYLENERGQNATNDFMRVTVFVDGNIIVPQHSVMSGNWQHVISQTFVATDITATLRIDGFAGSADSTALFDSMTITERTAPVIVEGNFENPRQPINNWEQANGVGGGSLVGSAWTITGGAGITRNISPFQNGGIPAPEGAQHALIQGTGGFVQTVSGFVPGATYEIRLRTMARQAGSFGNNLQVLLDAGLPAEESLINIPQVVFNSFTQVTDQFVADAASHTLTIRANLNGGALAGDRTTFIDDVYFVLISLPPTADIVLPPSAAPGVPLDFTLLATDDPADPAGNFTWDVDWGDGSPIEQFVGPSGTVVQHTYSTYGDYPISLIATDVSGSYSAPAGAILSVSPVAQVGNDIVAAGIDGESNRIIFSAASGGNVIVRWENSVSLGGSLAKTYGPFTPLPGGKLIAIGGDGDDTITVSNLAIPVEFHGEEGNDYLAGGTDDDSLFGDAGNDRLLGGYGNDLIDGGDDNDSVDAGYGDDIVFGGSGNDTLLGGVGDDVISGGDGNDGLTGSNGRDILLGGANKDSLSGGNDEDVLAGGETDYDTYSDPNFAALQALLAEWTSGNTYATRITNLKSGGGATLGNTLDPGTSVTNDDGEVDILKGAAGTDWFLASTTFGQVDLTDRVVASETLN